MSGNTTDRRPRDIVRGDRILIQEPRFATVISVTPTRRSGEFLIMHESGGMVVGDGEFVAVVDQ